ncbi:lipase chaperone [Hamadaea tsunoensis]|uniref:lipase chaperone n=1 Tax=Hamadaea tsunoensis TaxID=53368 RepID=UPI00041EB36B|nr:lipase chaperone [Hamadaea tsunoensis]
MTANRNGKARRAALRVVAVAGFAAAAWFLGGAAAHADAPIAPAQHDTAQGLLGSLLPADLTAAVGLRPVVEQLDTVLIGQTPPEPDPRPGLLPAVTQPLLDTVQAVVRPLVRPITTVAAPLARPAITAAEPLAGSVTAEVVAPAAHAIDAVAGPALTALPVGVRPLHHLSLVRENTVDESVSPMDTPHLAPPHRSDGDPRRIPLMAECPNGMTPTGGENRGSGAPTAALGASSVLVLTLARGLRRAADSALRRFDAPRPTSSPD